MGGVTQIQTRVKRVGRAEERVEGSVDFDLLGCTWVIVNDAGSLIDAGLLFLEVPPSVHNDAVDDGPERVVFVWLVKDREDDDR